MENMKKKDELTQVTLQAMFADSIIIRISPADGGFVCSIIENNTDNLSFEKYELVNTISRGMIAKAMNDTSEVFSAGMEAFVSENKRKIN